MPTKKTTSIQVIPANGAFGLQLLENLTHLTTNQPDLDSIFTATIGVIKNFFKTNQVSILKYHIKNQKLEYEYQKIGVTGGGRREEIDALGDGRDIVRSALATKKTSFIHSNQDNAPFAIEGTPLDTKIGIPIYYKQKILACINISCPKPIIADSDITHLGSLISRHLGIVSAIIIEQRHQQEFKTRTRKLLNAKIGELQDALDIADKYNQSLKDFSYIVSHDLREPLRTISSYIKLLDRRYRDTFDDDAKDFMFFVTNGVARMDALIKDLLAFSRVEHSVYQFEKVSLEKIMMLVSNSLRLKIEETSAQLSFDNPPEIMASKSHINILFQNLIDNGIKFRRDDVNPIIEITSTELDRHWQFTVKDNGIGMRLEHKNNERIFKIFQRLHAIDSDIPGTGIGLAICKNIVNAHGGKIWVSSELGVGSAFHFTISKR